MQPDEKKVLLSEIDDIAQRACRLMTDDERESYFVYQEERRNANQSLKTKYAVPIRTYYKGEEVGAVKRVYEVDGVLFEKLWDKLYRYAIKSAMGSHQSSHYNNPDVQNDVCDIRYQTFYVLRYFGPTPNGKPFSQFFLLIVNNILTTSARRRGVYREENEFLSWFDENKYDDFYFRIYQDYASSCSTPKLFLDYMYEEVYLEKYHRKNKAKILAAREKHEALMAAAREAYNKKASKKRFIEKPFVFNVGNCEATMINYKACSIFEERGGNQHDDDSNSYIVDCIEDLSLIPQDTDLLIQEILDNCVNSADISVLDDETMHKPIRRLIKGESLTQIAKSLNMKVEELRESLRGILPSLQ